MNFVASLLTKTSWSYGARCLIGMTGSRRPNWIETPFSYLYPITPQVGSKFSSVIAIQTELEFAVTSYLKRDAKLSVSLRPPFVEVFKENPTPISVPFDLLESLEPNAGLVGRSYSPTELVDRGIRLSDPETAHVLFAGTTGSGKTTAMQTFLLSVAWQTDCEMFFIDLKNRGLKAISTIPQVRAFAFQPNEASLIVEYVRQQVDLRVADSSLIERSIILAVDELSEFASAGIQGVFENNFPTIARLGRELNIHIIASTQKPEASQLGGQLLQQFGARIVGRLRTSRESADILGRSDTGAEHLPGKGAMLYIKGGDDPIRLQAFMPDVPRMLDRLKERAPSRESVTLSSSPIPVETSIQKFDLDKDIAATKDVFASFFDPATGTLRRGGLTRMATALGSDYGGSTITRVQKVVQVLSHQSQAGRLETRGDPDEEFEQSVRR